ncbi:MAG: electron transfer flavoprotein subunit beta/FixA family protein [candidate division KSB1 bacterium]|nr:electron transfer flavoprotein subunit beta/FixA family protein [candidate division KSB1 bacterium]MDZ7319462.1 electron transfer flavoprotein subunit beta/FixA family protein [candidate division KSB1 bacterium]MDZ7340393.1 electron transfer flavoprotein subunit beta/FixA family protein [candidate division KSB1 bacterium]
MNIIVLIKPIPDLSQLKISRGQGQVFETAKRIMNSQDRAALQLAIELKQAHGGGVSAISLCSMEDSDILREAYAIGADHCYQLNDGQFAGNDAYVNAVVLSRAISRIGTFDLIVCGATSDVGFSGQTGPRIAEVLNIPQATSVLSLSVQGNSIAVTSKMKGKIREQTLTLPALITAEQSICQPKIPNAMMIMKAYKKEIVIWNAQDLGLVAEEVGASAALTKVYSQYLVETA